MLVEESSMQGNQSLPLVIAELSPRRISLGNDLNTLLLDHDQSRVDALHLIDELLGRDRSGIWLQQDRGKLLWL